MGVWGSCWRPSKQDDSPAKPHLSYQPACTWLLQAGVNWYARILSDGEGQIGCWRPTIACPTHSSATAFIYSSAIGTLVHCRFACSVMLGLLDYDVFWVLPFFRHRSSPPAQTSTTCLTPTHILCTLRTSVPQVASSYCCPLSTVLFLA